MQKKVSLVITSILVVMLFVPTVFAATDNSVDRMPHVKDNHEFDNTLFVKLRIEEEYPGQFGTDIQNFRILLKNSQWYDDAHPLNVNTIKDQTITNDSKAKVSDIKRLTSDIIDISLDSGGLTNEKAVWVIPLFTKVTSAGYVTVTIDGRDSMVSSGTYPYAYAVGSRDDLEVQLDVIPPDMDIDQIPIRFEFDVENPIQLLLQEKISGAFYPHTQSFQLRLDKGVWFSDHLSELNVSAMKNDTEILGVKNVSVNQILRLSDEVIEIKIHQSEFSDDKVMLKVPLYFKIVEPGEVSLNIKLVGSSSKDQTYVIGTALIKDTTTESTQVQFTIGQKSYTLEDTTMEMDVSPYIKDVGDGFGRTMIPISFVSTALGSDSLEWNPEERKVMITKEDNTVILTIGSPVLTINDEITLMDVPAEIIDIGEGLGRTMVPIAYIAKALNVDYIWDETMKSVTFIKEN